MSLSQYYVSQNRKDLVERAIVAKREAEIHSARRRESAARYHRDLNLFSTQYKNIEDTQPGKTPRVNQESFIEEEVKAKTKEKFHARQQKLMLLLAQENEKYLRELKIISEDHDKKVPWDFAALKGEIEGLQRKRKQYEEILAKQSMALQYQINDNIFIDKYRTDALEKEVKAAWEKKKHDVEKKAAEKSEEDNKMFTTLEVQLNEAKSLAEQALIEQEELTKKWNMKVKEMTKKMSEDSAECEKLKVDIEILKSHEKVLDNVMKKRNDIKAIQNQQMKRVEMFRKSREKARKIATEVRNALEVDRATLNMLSQLNGKDKEESIAKLDLQIVNETLESVKNALAREEKRDSEFQVLFEEEAVKIMNERHHIYEEEMKAHEKSMLNVFESLGNQIRNKINECMHSQQSCMESLANFESEVEREKKKSESVARDIDAKHKYYVNKVRQLEEDIKRVRGNSAKWPPPKLRK